LEPKSSKFTSISILDASYDPSSILNWDIKSMSSSSPHEMVVVGCVALMDAIANIILWALFDQLLPTKKKGCRNYIYITK
jgi:hypothetical protein